MAVSAKLGVILVVLLVFGFNLGAEIKREAGSPEHEQQLDPRGAGASGIEEEHHGSLLSDEVEAGERLLPKRASLAKWYNGAVDWAKDTWGQLVGQEEVPTGPAAAAPPKASSGATNDQQKQSRLA